MRCVAPLLPRRFTQQIAEQVVEGGFSEHLAEGGGTSSNAPRAPAAPASQKDTICSGLNTTSCATTLVVAMLMRVMRRDFIGAVYS